MFLLQPCWSNHFSFVSRFVTAEKSSEHATCIYTNFSHLHIAKVVKNQKKVREWVSNHRSNAWYICCIEYVQRFILYSTTCMCRCTPETFSICINTGWVYHIFLKRLTIDRISWVQVVGLNPATDVCRRLIPSQYWLKDLRLFNSAQKVINVLATEVH